MNKDKEFIKEIKIEKKKRYLYNSITLIIFNLILLVSLIYMSSLIKTVFCIIVSILIFIACVVGSVLTVIKSKTSRKYVLYRDKIKIESTSFNGEIQLANVFLVKSKRNIFEFIFRKYPHTLVVYAKNMFKELYIMPYIAEDVYKLADEIMALAIGARQKFKENSNNN